MTSVIKKLSGPVLLACSFTMVSSAYATNGLFLISANNESRAMGGVGIGYAANSLSAAANPANLNKVGSRFDVDAIVFIPKAESCLGLTTATAVCDDSEMNGIGIDNVFMMGGAGFAVNGERWGVSNKWAFGFSFVAIGGGGTQFDVNLYNAQKTGADPTVPLGVNLMVGHMLPTVSYKVNENHTIGASLIIGIQRFRAYGLEQFKTFTAGFPAEDPNYLTDNGNEWTYGFGARIGWLGEFMNGDLSIGAAYTSETDMKELDKYKQLFAEQGDFNTPGSIGVGFSYDINSDFVIAADVLHTFYSDVNAVSNIGPNTSGNPFPISKEVNGLGADEGLGFGWEDQTVFKIGAGYDLNDTWTLRGGWNYGKSPIDEQREILFNIVAPATTQNHLTLGATYNISPNMELNASFVHAFEFTQSGPTQIGAVGQISMSQNSFGLGFGMGF